MLAGALGLDREPTDSESVALPIELRPACWTTGEIELAHSRLETRARSIRAAGRWSAEQVSNLRPPASEAGALIH